VKKEESTVDALVKEVQRLKLSLSMHHPLESKNNIIQDYHLCCMTFIVRWYFPACCGYLATKLLCSLLRIRPNVSLDEILHPTQSSSAQIHSTTYTIQILSALLKFSWKAFTKDELQGEENENKTKRQLMTSRAKLRMFVRSFAADIAMVLPSMQI